MAEQKANTTHDAALGWGILGLVFMAIAALVWHYFQYEIQSAFRWVRWAEIYLISLFVDKNYAITWNGENIPLHWLRDNVPKMTYKDLTPQALSVIGAAGMLPFKWFFMGCMGLMGLWCAMYGPGTQYRRKLGLEGIIHAQSGSFPYISPFVKFNPSTQPSRPPGAPVPADLPAFAEALGPEEWLAYNQIPIPDGRIDEQAAYIAFAKQLGPRWAGPLKLEPHKQVLLAAFCLKAARKRKESDEMLGRIAKCWSFEKGLQLGLDKKLLSDARHVLRDKNIAGKTLAKCNQHAFHTTALLQALLTARQEGGVLAPAAFVWLRAYDRTLWYPLNNLGRQAFHMEALGAMAHFKAERLTRRPVPRPKLDFAVQSIADYMKSARARPVPQVDYTGSKKRGVLKPKK